MWFDNKSVKRYELVNINIPAASTTPEWYFPDLPNLTDAKIEKINAYYAPVISKSPANIALISIADVQSAYLVLVSNDKEEIRIPLMDLVCLGQPGNILVSVNGYLPIHDKIIQWSKSYIKFVSSYAATAFTIQLGVFYYYDTDKSNQIHTQAQQQQQLPVRYSPRYHHSSSRKRF
jgi:hypothetical protein